MFLSKYGLVKPTKCFCFCRDTFFSKELCLINTTCPLIRVVKQIFALVSCRQYWIRACMTWLLQDPVLQPSKLKFLRGRHLETNSLGLGRLFYKSSHQLQNFRRHGDQNGRKLEGCVDNTKWSSKRYIRRKVQLSWIKIWILDYHQSAFRKWVQVLKEHSSTWGVSPLPERPFNPFQWFLIFHASKKSETIAMGKK